jgi:hypothetical protein
MQIEKNKLPLIAIEQEKNKLECRSSKVKNSTAVSAKKRRTNYWIKLTIGILHQLKNPTQIFAQPHASIKLTSNFSGICNNT